MTGLRTYGTEQRCGTANGTVIISDERIFAPLLQTYNIAVVLNQPSMDKFESKVKPGGILIYDPNGMTREPERKDISVYKVAASDMAAAMNAHKTFNMIVLGGLLKVDPIVGMEDVMLGLKKSLPERHHKLLPANEAAMAKGAEIITKVG